MKSNTDKDAPRRAIPYTESDDPMRKKVLRDSEDANCMKSNTDKDEPRRPMPYTDKEEPKRAKPRSDIEEPT